MTGRELRKLVGQQRCGFIAAVTKGIKVLHLQRLIINRLGHFFAAVTDVDTPKAGDSIEKTIVIGIRYKYAIGLGNNLTALVAKRGEVRVRVNKMIPIHLP